ncbi:hypothetical protein ACFL4W_02130, partial [Planctomycetota bacterium]
DGVAFRLSDCTFDNCSLLYVPYGNAPGSSITIERCVWSNSIPKFSAGFGQSYILNVKSGAGAPLLMQNNYFDEKVLIFDKTEAVIQDNVFDKAFSFHAGVHTTFLRNFVRWQTNGQFSSPYGAPLTDNMFIMDFSSWNPHYIGISGNTGETVLSGNIFGFTTPEPSAEGDGFMLGGPASGTRAENSIIIENTIILPNGNGPSAANNLTCTLFTILFDAPDKSVTARGNTIFTNSIGGCNVGETQTAYTGDVAYCKSNLFVGDINNAGYKIHNLGNSQTDVVAAADADYNASFRCGDGTDYGVNAGKGYYLLDFSGSTDIGEHDIDDVDPQFVDWTRTAATWDASLGGPGTLDSAAQRMAPGGGNTMQELLDYIREGFRPTNEVLRGAGDPGAGSPDIGAVDMAAGPSIIVSIPAAAAEGDGVLAGQGTVTLSVPASGNQIINLSSNDTSEITVDAQVTVIDTQTTAGFDLTVLTDGIIDGSQTVTISAFAGGWTGGQAVIQVADDGLTAATGKSDSHSGCQPCRASGLLIVILAASGLMMWRRK